MTIRETEKLRSMSVDDVKGTLKDRRFQQAFQDMGFRDIPSLHTALYDGRLRFERRTPAGAQEGSVHSVHSYVEPRFGIR